MPSPNGHSGAQVAIVRRLRQGSCCEYQYLSCSSNAPGSIVGAGGVRAEEVVAEEVGAEEVGAEEAGTDESRCK